MPRKKRVYTEANKSYLQEENKISSLSKDWLSMKSKLIQSQAQTVVEGYKKSLKGKWFKDVLISDTPKTWKIIEVEKGTPGAYQI
jgi:hypothetical protein